MSLFTSGNYKPLQKSLPKSHMVFPDSTINRVKYIFWRIYTPLHPFLRDLTLKTGIVSAEKKVERWGARQRFLLGTIVPTETVESVIQHLIGQGFFNHFVAWEDDGEVVSLRYSDNFSHQYHIRIFEDGEVRGHYEYTPECHPIKHYYEIGCFEPRREEFLRVLGNKIIPVHSS